MPKRIAAALASLAIAVGCATMGRSPPPEVTPPAVLCLDPSLEDDDFCLPSERAEAMLETSRLEILSVETAPSGFSRPKKIYLRVPSGRQGEPIVFASKWKPAPRGGEGFNNSPRKEMAAYEFQKLFLDTDEYVVPPTVIFCIPVAQHSAEIADEPPTFPGTECVFGLAAYWLENVTVEKARDLDRFERDEAYRASLAKLNLVTHLIDQRDSREANFLRSTDPDRPRVFSVDNGLAFGGFKNPFAVMGFIPTGRRSTYRRCREVKSTDCGGSRGRISIAWRSSPSSRSGRVCWFGFPRASPRPTTRACARWGRPCSSD